MCRFAGVGSRVISGFILAVAYGVDDSRLDMSFRYAAIIITGSNAVQAGSNSDLVLLAPCLEFIALTDSPYLRAALAAAH